MSDYEDGAKMMREIVIKSKSKTEPELLIELIGSIQKYVNTPNRELRFKLLTILEVCSIKIMTSNVPIDKLMDNMDKWDREHEFFNPSGQ